MTDGTGPGMDHRALQALRSRFPAHRWEPVTVGASGAAVHRLAGRPAYYLKAARCSPHLDGGSSLAAEAERLPWLARHGIPAPEVVEYGADGGVEWLVTTAVPGRSAAEPWPVHQRAGVVDALADLARGLHAIAPEECPFDRSVRVVLAAARHAVDHGPADPGRLPHHQDGQTTAELFAGVAAAAPRREDLVVCHGDYCVPNVLLDPDTLAVTGVIDVGRLGTADRYADLALATRSLDDPTLNPQYQTVSGGAGHRFLRRYGAWPADPDRLSFYRLLDGFF